MQYATLYYETKAEDSDHSAQNLIDNKESRSSSNEWNSRTEAAWEGARAAYKSCYRTNQTNIAADGDQVKLVFGFQFKHFIHAVLMLDD